MKKILGVVIALLVIWMAGLLYAGHQTEKLISQYVDKINQIYQQAYSGAEFELKLKKFDSNFFNAKAQYAIKIDIPGLEDKLNFGLDEGDIVALKNAFKTPFIINQDIQYGPVFFDKGLEFAMAKISFQSTLSNFVKAIAEKILPHFESEQQENEKQLGVLISNIKQVLEKEVILDFNSVLPFFSNKIKTTGVISEIRINDKSNLLVFDKMTFDSVSNLQDFTGQSNFNIPNITFKNKNGQTSMKGLSVTNNINEVIDAFNIFSDTKFSIQKLDIYSPKDGDISLSTSILIKISKNKVPNLNNTKASVKLEVLKYPKQGKIMPYDLPRVMQLSLSLNGVNSKEFAEIFDKLENFSPTKGGAKKIEFPVDFLNDIASNLDSAFVKNVSNLNFNADITTTKQPKIHNVLNFNVVYDFDKGDIKKLLTMVSKNSTEASKFAKDKVNANLKIKVNADMLKQFKPMLVTPINQGILEEKHGFYQTNVNYKEGKLIVNGKDMSAILQQLKSK